MESNVCPVFSSLIEEDILQKLETYFAVPGGELRVFTLEQFIAWFDNPLLLWDMLYQAVQSLDFYTFIERVHSVCQLFSEGKQYEEEAYQSLCAIYRQQRSLLRIPPPSPSFSMSMAAAEASILPLSPPLSLLSEPLPFYGDPTLEMGTPSPPLPPLLSPLPISIPKGY